MADPWPSTTRVGPSPHGRRPRRGCTAVTTKARRPPRSRHDATTTSTRGEAYSSLIVSPVWPECRVDFLGIGSQKAATTWLFHELRGHPRTRFPVGKEFHYWDVHRSAGLSAERYFGRFPPRRRGVRQGYITPRYAVLPSDTIAAMAEAMPNVKLFCTVRNPLPRVWSALEMVRNFGRLDPTETSERFYLDQIRSQESIRRSDFSQWLVNWRAHFPAERLHVIEYDDISADPRQVLVALAGYLGIDPGHFATRAEDALRQNRNPGRPTDVSSVPPPAVVEELRAVYAPRIPAMSEALGRDVSAWLEWDGARR